MTRKSIAELFKRFLLTFVCMLPIFIVVGILLQNKVSDVVMTIIFVVLGGAGVALEELIHFKRVEKREQMKREIEKNGK